MIHSARFLVSNSTVDHCPKSSFPEYAFIGRSNVGKSSLINAMANNKKLAKTSGAPGKTKLINHFLINDAWCMVDLPGYGYAKISKQERNELKKLINGYFAKRGSAPLVKLNVDLCFVVILNHLVVARSGFHREFNFRKL